METRIEEKWTPDRLKKLRKNLGICRGHRVSQEYLARECGVSGFTAGSWERGHTEPAFYNAIANLLRLEREVLEQFADRDVGKFTA